MSSGQLVRRVEQLRHGHMSLNGVAPLPDNAEALRARLSLIAAAQESIELQTYILTPDASGHAVMGALAAAADRGVRVRLLVDDYGSPGVSKAFNEELARDNFELRTFNAPHLGMIRSVAYLVRLPALHRRMHNKALIVDGALAIVGGRNIGNVYFQSESETFVDLDVLILGGAATKILSSFEEYWDSRLSRQLRRPSENLARTPSSELSPADTWIWDRIQGDPSSLLWTTVTVVADAPSKLRGPDGTANIGDQLSLALPTAKKELDLVSPYFIPTRNGTRRLTTLASSGVAITILTNSFGATNSTPVHAAYTKYRNDLLDAGVNILEFKPDSRAVNSENIHSAIRPPTSTLHAKTFGVDGSHVFIGSMNFDPRSVRLNTELGVVIESPAMADDLHRYLAGPCLKDAYSVRRGAGGRLEWVEKTDGVDVVHVEEPNTSRSSRLVSGFLRLLPIDGFL